MARYISKSFQWYHLYFFLKDRLVMQGELELSQSVSFIRGTKANYTEIFTLDFKRMIMLFINLRSQNFDR